MATACALYFDSWDRDSWSGRHIDLDVWNGLFTNFGIDEVFITNTTSWDLGSYAPTLNAALTWNIANASTMDISGIRNAGYTLCVADVAGGAYSADIASIWSAPSVLSQDNVCYCFGPVSGWVGGEFLGTDKFVAVPSAGGAMHSVHAAVPILSYAYHLRGL